MKRKILDAHLHWWDLDNNYYPWLCDEVGDKDGVYEPGKLSKNYLPKHYLQDAIDYDVVGAVHIQAEWDHKNDIGETQWLTQLANSHEGNQIPFVIVAFANLADSKVEALLAKHCQYPHVRGIRQMLNYQQNNPDYCWAPENYLENPTWLKQFKLLEKYQLSFDLMCFSHQMPAMAKVAQQHKNTQIILEHCGMPNGSTDVVNEWRKGVELLAKNDNVSCKIGGLGTMMPNWSSVDAQSIFDILLNAFGSERIMFATNFPTESLFCDYNYTVEEWLKVMTALSANEQDDIFVNNARKFYKF